MNKSVKIAFALVIGFLIALILMSVVIYFGYTNAYRTSMDMLVKRFGIPIYELTESGTAYVGETIGILMELGVEFVWVSVLSSNKLLVM